MSHTMPKIITLLLVATFAPPAAQKVAAQEAASSSLDYQRYRVELKISELQRGKTVNSRSYLMMMAKSKKDSHAVGRIRVGNRVPYAVAASQFQYQDVGMNIDCTLTPLDGDHVLADLIVESSNLTGERETVSPANANPVFRNLRWQGTPAVVLGKPTVVSEVDDVTSDHRYQIEMTATEIK